MTALASTKGSIEEKESQVATLRTTIAQLRTKIALQPEATSVGRSALGSGAAAPDNTKLMDTLKGEPTLLLVRVFQDSAQTLVNTNAAPSGMRLEFGGPISGHMRLSFQAARSIG
ncbi:MAG: hypothetical protein AB7S93_13395 [Xanthobacteraceae bacterium]